MLLKHDERKLKNDSNIEIVANRSALNYSIPHTHNGLTDRAYYKNLISENYLYGRGTQREAEAVTCGSWVVTLPREVSDYYGIDKNEVTRINPKEEDAFFKGVYDFVTARYGNSFHNKIHFDEGGQPHIHIMFCPITKLDHEQVQCKTKKTKMEHRTDSGRYILII